MIFENYKYIIERRNKDIYNLAGLVATFMWSKTPPEFEDVFPSYNKSDNNAVVKELFLDYASNWNKKFKKEGSNA